MIPIDAWLPVDGLTLEPNALRAAKEQTSCLALTAGPGAGKTEMLAQRADFLLRTGVCRYPSRILAVSFKVDASKNLKERVLYRCGADLASRFDSYTFHGFAKRIIDKFRVLLTGDDALDVDYQIGDRKVTRRQIEFNDLVPLAVQILKKSSIARNAIRQTYSDVFFDEFQDCTEVQYELVKLAFQGTSIRLIAVGDTKQKIMGWAGALDGIFETFVGDFSAIPLNMYRNFRSKPRLLRMQNEIIRVLDPASVMPEDQVAGEEGEVFIEQFESAQEEAEHLANLIANWIEIEQIPLSEIAVLISKQLDLYASHLIAAFERKGIVYRNEYQMQDLTVEPAARLVVDYLLCLYGHREHKAWELLRNQLTPFANEDAQASVWQEFQNFFKEQRRNVSIDNLIGDEFSKWWGFTCNFLKEIGIETLVTLSADYESHNRLKDILKNTKLRIEELLEIEPNLLKALARFSEDQAVRILTIHKSKGLEFDSVIIMAVENEIFFGKQAEERCAFFVGMSRAKRRLVLTCAKQRERPADHRGRWDVVRTYQEEYFNYAVPFLKNAE